jgi:hypothetical protein
MQSPLAPLTAQSLMHGVKMIGRSTTQS